MATPSNNVIFSFEEISKKKEIIIESLHVQMLPTLFAQIDVLTQLLISTSSTLSHSNDNSCIVMQSVFFSPEIDQFPLLIVIVWSTSRIL